MNPMLAGFSSASSDPLKSGMPLKLSANTISEVRPQSISTISSTPPKMPMVLIRVFQAVSEEMKSGRSPASSRRLTSYRPRHMNGPISRKPALNASV